MKHKRSHSLSMVDGYVIHNRISPKKHRFKNKMCWGLFDLDKLQQCSDHSKLFSYNKWGLSSLYDKDYVDASSKPIKSKITHFISKHSKQQFSGRVLLFTHPRFLGYGFNSVNFYFCYQNNQLDFIVSEINNTPWGEKHLYFHDCTEHDLKNESLESYHFSFDKAFHISPFVAMDMNYQWDFKVNEDELKIKMSVNKNHVNILNVILDTKITPLMENEHHKLVLKRPFQPWKMSLGIYWQAFKLWLKKVPFHDHPNNNKQ